MPSWRRWASAPRLLSTSRHTNAPAVDGGGDGVGSRASSRNVGAPEVMLDDTTLRLDGHLRNIESRRPDSPRSRQPSLRTQQGSSASTAPLPILRTSTSIVPDPCERGYKRDLTGTLSSQVPIITYDSMTTPIKHMHSMVLTRSKWSSFHSTRTPSVSAPPASGREACSSPGAATARSGQRRPARQASPRSRAPSAQRRR